MERDCHRLLHRNATVKLRVSYINLTIVDLKATRLQRSESVRKKLKPLRRGKRESPVLRVVKWPVCQTQRVSRIGCFRAPDWHIGFG